ncbi:MAG: hypothetical protein L0241_04820 [Planctomycetia bacterium]|nr:hypothetical protein [Planctomycetia bacterium]
MNPAINLFSSMARWATRQDENVLTEAFVCLLHHLRERQPDIGHPLLSWVCFGDGPETMPIAAVVDTQWDTELGRPDVRAEAENVLCLIEVKKWSEFGATQIERYRDILLREPHQTKRLVLLTARPVPDSEIAAVETPVLVRRLRWAEIAVRLNDLRLSDPVAAFLTSQFVAFLRAEGLTMEPVTTDLSSGARAFRRLLWMIEAGLTRAGIPVHKAPGAWGEVVGLYLDGKRYWVGVAYDRAHVVRFAFAYAQHDAQRFAALGRGSLSRGKPLFELDLSAPDLKFFDLPAHKQLDTITDFLASAYRDCRDCLAVGAIAPPPPNPATT